jgi:hypothetical protein
MRNLLALAVSRQHGGLLKARLRLPVGEIALHAFLREHGVSPLGRTLQPELMETCPLVHLLERAQWFLVQAQSLQGITVLIRTFCSFYGGRPAVNQPFTLFGLE